MSTKNMNNELWKKLKSSITKSDLVELSKSDRGFDAEGHYAALLDIYENNKMPQRLKWEPREVVSLTTWSDYSGANKKQISVVFFCAYILLEALKNKENLDYIDGSNQEIILAIDCANLLGSNWLNLLSEYLQNLYNEVNKERLEEEVIYFSLGISIISLLLNEQKTFLKWAERTYHDVDSVEKTEFFNKNDSILGYTFFDGRLDLWKKYLDEHATQMKKSPINKVLKIT